MILIKEEFVGGEKWRRAIKLAGSDAIALWLALKCYCSQHPDTEGFVPAEVLEDLPGAPRRASKALAALIDCGRLLPGGVRGAGLVEVAAGGWQMHDYLDHSVSPEEIELRRQKARLRQQSHRERQRRELAAVKRLQTDLALPEGEAGLPSEGPLAGGVTPLERDRERDTERDTERDRDATSHAGAPPPEGAREHAPTRARAHPSPTLPNPTQKTLRRLPSTIRETRASPGELARRVEACAEHRLFAAENGLEIEPFLAELRGAPDAARLSSDELRTRLAAMLASAAAERETLGGAA